MKPLFGHIGGWTLVLLLGALPAMAAPQEMPRWLMMVATRCTDAAREAEFNDWYDRIDVPDVLEVPGYQRARRGELVDRAVPAQSPLPTIGQYVALYNIDSRAIDKTIIDMLMMARRMDERGRGTPLIRVTERAYYREYAPLRAAPGKSKPSGGLYVFVERVDCCATPAATRAFDAWYDREHIGGALRRTAVLSATRYELYRILMTEPQAGSRFLTLYEMSASTPAAAQLEADALRADVLKRVPADEWTTQRSLLFRQRLDAARPGRP